MLSALPLTSACLTMVYSARTLYPKVLVYWSATPILLTKADDTGCAYASRTLMENIFDSFGSRPSVVFEHYLNRHCSSCNGTHFGLNFSVVSTPFQWKITIYSNWSRHTFSNDITEDTKAMRRLMSVLQSPSKDWRLPNRWTHPLGRQGYHPGRRWGKIDRLRGSGSLYLA